MVRKKGGRGKGSKNLGRDRAGEEGELVLKEEVGWRATKE